MKRQRAHGGERSPDAPRRRDQRRLLGCHRRGDRGGDGVKLLMRADVQGVGKKGDLVEVADGYGRNYLVPKGLAITASNGASESARARASSGSALASTCQPSPRK